MTMRLRQRITLPFVLLFVAAHAVTAIVCVSLVASAVERRLVKQTEDLAHVLAGFPGLRQPPMLAHIQKAYRADAFVYEDEILVAGTGTPPSFRPEPGRLQDNGAVYAPIGRDHGLLLVYAPSVVSREKADAVRPVLLVAAVALLSVVFLGWATGQALARPLERLARGAREISSGRTDVSLPSVGSREIRDLSDALNRMLESTRKAERLAALGQLAAGVAHEIKNPLSAMKMTVQMLREEQKPESREPYEVLLREIERLELAAGELSAAGPRPLVRQSVRLDVLVDDVLRLLQRQLEHLRVRIERSFETRPDVRVDVEQFKRVVLNLVLNGAQAMPQGGPLTIALTARGDRARLSVADAGPGIPEALRPRIFEPFVTTKADGVGLGLALTKRIVEDHGGRIGFDTSAAGTRFWVEL
ncbi:MAG: HAMP domain-containing protein [Planctomycetes bacterium]|nr:HAMP domain-containing protein [Planctomycetota bacterium]